MTDETRHIQVLLGPYRDHRLMVSAADAEAAINNHWAVDPNEVFDPDHQHPPLSEEERTAALEAATAWAQLQWDTAQGVTQEPPPPTEETDLPPPEGGATRRRAMRPGEAAEYRTRHTEPKEPNF